MIFPVWHAQGCDQCNELEENYEISGSNPHRQITLGKFLSIFLSGQCNPVSMWVASGIVNVCASWCRHLCHEKMISTDCHFYFQL